MSRIGILGGTFNPIHMGHLLMAQAALEQMKLKKVLFIPSFLPPHKSIKKLAGARDRLNMVRAAVRGNTAFEASDLEYKRKGKSYTIDTLNQLKEKFPRGTQFYFIIGGDAAPKLKTWKNIKELTKLTSFIAINRPEYAGKSKNTKVHTVLMPGVNISSSHLRRLLYQRKSIKYLVPDSVFEYIKKRKLYND